MRIASLFTAAFVTALMSFSAVADNGEHMDFTAANQCRSKPNDTKRLTCYDEAVTPMRPKTLEKFESRDQCRYEAWKEKRLTCYDYFFPPTFTDAQVKKNSDKVSGDVGDWKANITTSPIDDSKNVVISIDGNDSFRDPFGQMTIPTLYVACRENKTELFINWGVYLGLDKTTMIHRIDKQKAVNKVWSISTDTKAVFYDGKVIDFIKKLESGHKLFTQITPYNESPVSTTFNLSGLSEVIKPLQESCGWK
ncbi:type VI secretion protein [Salmonella enterica]|nr:type VI secretion protein [Salmonella enterica]